MGEILYFCWFESVLLSTESVRIEELTVYVCLISLLKAFCEANTVD